jgi:hypothetical protein
MNNSFNTNLAAYTMDDLFKLLDITIKKDTTVDDIKKQVTDTTQVYIDKFTSLNKPEIVDFFKDVRASLIDEKGASSLSTAEQLVLQYDAGYVPFNSKAPGGNTKSGDMFDSNNGAGNPIHRKTVSKLLNVDSKFRANYLNTSPTDFLVDLSYPINNVIEMKLCDLELPTTYYPINTTNQHNYFWFATYTQEQVFFSSPDIYYFIVPDGNYYFDNLITYINTQISLLSTPTGEILPISMVFDLNYNNLGGIGNGTGRTSLGILTASSSGIGVDTSGAIIRVDLNFNAPPLPGIKKPKYVSSDAQRSLYLDPKYGNQIPIQQRFGWMLGFRDAYYTGAPYYISEATLDVIGSRYLYLILDDFNQNNNVNFLSSSKYGLLPDNIIARISLKGAAFNIQSQNDFSVYSEPRYYYGPVNISKLHIRLVDEFSRNVNINMNDLSFTLRMTTIYSVT